MRTLVDPAMTDRLLAAEMGAAARRTPEPLADDGSVWTHMMWSDAQTQRCTTCGGWRLGGRHQCVTGWVR